MRALRGSTPGFRVLGRETFLAGIDWVEGWPVVVEFRFDVPVFPSAFTDDLAGEVLDARWVVPDGEPAALVERHAGGGVSFRLSGGSSDLLCILMRDFAWESDALVEFADELRLRLDDRNSCGLIVEAGIARVIVQIGDVRQEVAATRRHRAVNRHRRRLPRLARLDGRYFSTEVAAGFTGRMLAIGSPSRVGRVHSVSYRPAR